MKLKRIERYNACSAFTDTDRVHKFIDQFKETMCKPRLFGDSQLNEGPHEWSTFQSSKQVRE